MDAQQKARHLDKSPSVIETPGFGLSTSGGAEGPEVALPSSINLRDLSEISETLRNGIMFRGSQLYSPEDMKRLGIKAILDLRSMDRPCMKSEEKFARRLLTGPKSMIPERYKVKSQRAVPHRCERCSAKCEAKCGADVTLYHADMLSPRVKMHIFRVMPARVQLKTVAYAFAGKAEEVMAPAVANPALLGYENLYQMLLSGATRGVAKAVRVFADPANFPLLVHCIHGKDRTGVVTMLVLTVCGISREAIVTDYAVSEVNLRKSRDNKTMELHGYLTTDEVLASTAQTMEHTISFLEKKFGSVERYLTSIGITDEELSAIRLNLMQRAQPKDLMERLRRNSSLGASRGSMLRRMSSGGGSGGMSPGGLSSVSSGEIRRLAASSLGQGQVKHWGVESPRSPRVDEAGEEGVA